jgi:hypothetical protein
MGEYNLKELLCRRGSVTAGRKRHKDSFSSLHQKRKNTCPPGNGTDTSMKTTGALPHGPHPAPFMSSREVASVKRLNSLAVQPRSYRFFCMGGCHDLWRRPIGKLGFSFQMRIPPLVA